MNLGGTGMNGLFARLWKEEEGQDLTEYALLLVLISLALVASISSLSAAIAAAFGNATTTLNT
jgi:Flp pilus assembly pilin Flp